MAGRYATALFALALEQNAVDAVKADLDRFEALAREPKNVDALAGEGAALAEKGALAKAKEKLAQVEKVCGKQACAPAQALAAAIARGPVVRIQTAEAVVPTAQPAQAN